MHNYKRKIMLTSTLFLGVFCANEALAQYTAQDVTGKVWRTNSYSEVTGSPFLLADWSRGIVKYANSPQVVNGIELKYDQIDDVLLFKDSKGETLELVDPISEFKIGVLKPGYTEQRLFKSGFKPVGKLTEKSFYEILSDGNVKFVKKDLKTIMEETEYNSPTTTKKIITKTSYYIVKDNQPVLVNKNEKSILAAIGDKTLELGGYIKQEKLNMKNDDDILKVLEYYFNLTKK